MLDVIIARLSATSISVLILIVNSKVLEMAQVIVGLKVMPKTVEIDLDQLETDIKNSVNPERIEREPIAFGLVVFHVTKILPDAEGELQKIENKLKAIDTVGEVEVTGVTRSL